MDASEGLLVRHWRDLDGTAHPQDRAAFETAAHTFNLDWPPAAFIGDILNAPFVLLMMNGGYDPRDTPREFLDPSAGERHLNHLHNPGPIDPQSVAPYYANTNYARHIASGRLALINAVAYRSGRLSDEPRNRTLADRLPSTHLHRRWLHEILIPQALDERRTIIAHRNGMWNLKRDAYDDPGIVFTPSAVSPNLPRSVISLIDGSGATIASRETTP